MNPSEQAATSYRLCVVIPSYDNPLTVGDTVRRLRQTLPVILVDDGSHEAGRLACAEAAKTEAAITAAANSEAVELLRLERNSGKGAAVMAGFARARALGYTHAFQIDADGQHDLDAVPAFVAASEASPEALVLGYPEYDSSAPRVRRTARRLTEFWVAREVGVGVIRDALIGFRIYPLAATASLPQVGPRMEFDVEIAVRLAWLGLPVVNLPVKIRYPSAEEGGISHFSPLRDTLRLSWMHSRLCTELCITRCLRWFGLMRSTPQLEPTARGQI